MESFIYGKDGLFGVLQFSNPSARYTEMYVITYWTPIDIGDSVGSRWGVYLIWTQTGVIPTCNTRNGFVDLSNFSFMNSQSVSVLDSVPTSLSPLASSCDIIRTTMNEIHFH